MGRRGAKRGNTDGRATGQQRQNAANRESNSQNKRGGKSGNAASNANNKTPDTPSTPNLPPQDDHTPLKGFNSEEIDQLLARGFDAKAPVYKLETQPQKSGNVWGAKRMISCFCVNDMSLISIQQAPWRMAKTSGSNSGNRSQHCNRRAESVKAADTPSSNSDCFEAFWRGVFRSIRYPTSWSISGANMKLIRVKITFTHVSIPLQKSIWHYCCRQDRTILKYLSKLPPFTIT